MSGFLFRFEALLKYRCYRRDLLSSLLAQIVAQKTNIEDQRLALQQKRAHQIDEMRGMTDLGSIDIDAMASRRFHAGSLTIETAHVDRQIQLVDEQLEACRQAVITAEQDVETLERLKTKQRTKHEFEQQKRQQRELEDVWISAHAGEYAV